MNFGGILNRVRGGWGNVGSTAIGRAIFAIPTAAYGAWMAENWWALAAAPLLYAGLVPGWGSWMDLKRMPDRFDESLDPLFKLVLEQGTYTYEFLAMTVRGLVLTAPAGIIFYLCGLGPWFALSGGLMGLVYELAWRIPSKEPNFEQGPPLAEFIFGALLWTALSFPK